MQAIEFNYNLQDGVIKIPESYRDWFQKSFSIYSMVILTLYIN